MAKPCYRACFSRTPLPPPPLALNPPCGVGVIGRSAKRWSTGDKHGPFCEKTAVGGRKILGVLRQQKLSRTLQICKQWSWFSIFFAPAALPGTLGADSKPSQPPTHRPVDRIRHSVLRRYYRYSIGTPKDVVLIILSSCSTQCRAHQSCMYRGLPILV